MMGRVVVVLVVAAVLLATSSIAMTEKQALAKKQDRRPPETTITAGPSGTVGDTSASFSFTANEPSTFECALDDSTWQSCTSPESYSDLPDGQHTFHVRATDPAGNTDRTPAERVWSVQVQEPPPPPPPTGSGCTSFSGPITITAGGTCTGCWQSNTFDTPAVTVDTTSPVIIQNSGIKAGGFKVASGVGNTDITIRHSYFYGENPDVPGESTEYAVNVIGPQNLVVEHSHFEQTTGVKVYDMFAPRSGGITVRYNTAHNIDARTSNGSGGYDGGYALRQFFQTDHAVGVPVEVAWNQIINDPGNSAVEDNINLYLSRGTPSSPINIHDNYIDGAFPAGARPGGSVGSYTGSGILCGDGVVNTESETPAYLYCHDNQVVDSLNVGVGAANGHNIELARNRTVGDADGISLSSWDGVGMYCINMNNAPSYMWFSNTIHDNVSAWIANGHRNDYWLDGSCLSVNETSLPTVDEAAEQ